MVFEVLMLPIKCFLFQPIKYHPKVNPKVRNFSLIGERFWGGKQKKVRFCSFKFTASLDESVGENRVQWGVFKSGPGPELFLWEGPGPGKLQDAFWRRGNSDVSEGHATFLALWLKPSSGQRSARSGCETFMKTGKSPFFCFFENTSKSLGFQ